MIIKYTNNALKVHYNLVRLSNEDINQSKSVSQSY